MLFFVVVLDVGPEFLQNLGDRIRGELRPEALDVIEQRAFPGVVSVADASGGGVAKKFREVEHRPAAVIFGDKDASGGVPGASPLRAVAPAKVARVFVEQHGEDAFGEVVSDDLVPEAGEIAMTEADGALAEGGVRVVALGDGGKDESVEENRAIGAVFCGDPELAAVVDGRVGGGFVGSTVVGQDSEDALVDGEFAGLDRFLWRG